MSRRIWITEGSASDGEVYGRALQLPDGNIRRPSDSHGGGEVVRRAPAVVFKSAPVDMPSCPCLAAPLLQDGGTGVTDA